MQKRWYIIIALIIASIILLFLIWQQNNKKIEISTLSSFNKSYNSLTDKKLDTYLERESDIRKYYKLQESTYLIMEINSKKEIEKVYLSVLKDTDKNIIKDYLLDIVKSVNSNINSKEVKEIVDKLIPTDGMKADELGFYVTLETSGYQYMTVLKDGKLNFFVYQDNSKNS